MTDLTIGNATFRVQVDGDPTKPALLLSNPLGADLSIWDRQVSDLAKHFRVVRYDTRGHGGSTIGDGPASLADLGSDALAVLDALEIEKAHLIGLSLGGAVGIWLLVHAPQRINRAVLAHTAAKIGSEETWNARIAAVLEAGMADNAAATIERWFTPEFAEREPQRVQAVYDMLCKTSPRGYAHACAALRDMDLRAALRAIDKDVLVLSGRADPVISEGNLDVLVSAIVGAQHIALETRHISNIEAHLEFNAAVITFLTRPKRKATTSAAKSATRKAAPLKRGGAGRRSNPARSPLKKVATKRVAAKKTRRGGSTETSVAGRRHPTKLSTARRTTTKTAAKRPVKSSRKATARRPTSATKARGPATKKAVATRKKTTVKKPTTKTSTKKLPTARRKPARPTGRRKK